MVYHLLKFVSGSSQLRVILNDDEYRDFKTYGYDCYYLEYQDGTNDTFKLSKDRALSPLGMIRYSFRVDMRFYNVIMKLIDQDRGYEKGSAMDLLLRLSKLPPCQQ